jgi:hypothetical protein
LYGYGYGWDAMCTGIGTGIGIDTDTGRKSVRDMEMERVGACCNVKEGGKQFC